MAKALANREKRYDYSDYVLPVAKPNLDEPFGSSQDNNLDYYLPLGRYHVNYLPKPLETVVLKYSTLPQKVEVKQPPVVPSFVIQGSDEFEVLQTSGEHVEQQEKVDASNNEAFYMTTSIKIHLTPSPSGSEMSLQIPQSVSGSISSDKSSSMSDLSLDHESISQRSEKDENEEKYDHEEKSDNDYEEKSVHDEKMDNTKNDDIAEEEDQGADKVSASTADASAVNAPSAADASVGDLSTDDSPSPIQPSKESKSSSQRSSPSAVRRVVQSHAPGEPLSEQGSFNSLTPGVAIFSSSSRLQDSPTHLSASMQLVQHPRNISPTGSMNLAEDISVDGGVTRRNRVNGSKISLRSNTANGSKASLRSTPQLNAASSSKVSLASNPHVNIVGSQGSISSNKMNGSKGSLLGAGSKISLKSTQSRRSMRNVQLPNRSQLALDQQVSMRNLGIKSVANSSVRSLNDAAMSVHSKNNAGLSGSNGVLSGRESPAGSRPSSSQSLDRQRGGSQTNKAPSKLGITMAESRSLRTVYKGGQDKKLALQSGGSLNYQVVRSSLMPGDVGTSSGSGGGRTRGATPASERTSPTRPTPETEGRVNSGSPRQYRGKEVSNRFGEVTHSDSDPSLQHSRQHKQGTKEKKRIGGVDDDLIDA